MDSTEVDRLITTALQTQPFTISGADLGSAPITTLLTTFLGEDGLVLTGAQRAPTAGTVVTGQLARPVAGQAGLQATATFGATAGTATLHIELTGLPADWTPSRSFPALTGTVFDRFGWAKPVLTLDSAAPPALPPDYPGGYGYPALPAQVSASLVPGLGLAAEVTPTQQNGILSTLLAGRPCRVSGPILPLPATSDQKGGDQKGVAAALDPTTSGTDVALGPLSAAFGVSLVAVPLQATPPTGSIITTGSVVTTGAYRLGCDLRADLDGTMFDLPLVVWQQSPDTPVLVIQTHRPPDQAITLAQVAALIGGSATPVSALTARLPTGTDFPVLQDIVLRDLQLVVTTAADPVLSVAATVAWRPRTPYSAFGGLFTFNEMAVTFTYLPSAVSLDDGSTTHVTVDVTATATVAGGRLDAELILPEIAFSLALAEGTTLDIAALVQAAVGDSISMPHVTCSALSISGDVSAGTYRFKATVTDDWTFTLGRTPFALTRIDMDITKDPTGFSGEIACQVNIAGTTLYGRAAHDAATGGWAFEVGTIGAAGVRLNALVQDVADLLGVTLPDHAPQVVLDSINLSFDTATRAFTFRCATTLTVAGAAVTMGVEISNSAFTGYLWIGDSYFQLDFMNTDNRSALTATWQATAEQAQLGIADLTGLLGLPDPQVPEGLDPRLSAAGLSYGFGSGEFVVTAQSQTYGKLVFVAAPVAVDTGPATTQFFVMLAAGRQIALSDLPLLGEALSPADTCAVEDLTVVIASTSAPAATAQVINQLVPAGYPMLPTTGTTGRVALSATVRFGAQTFPITLGAAPRSGGPPPGPGPAPAVPATTVGAPQGGTSVTATPPAKSDGTAWFTVQKAFGPITFERVGVRYADGTVWFLLDAALVVGGLALTLQGASVGSPLTTFSPRFDLRGLGVAYSKPPLTIGGGFAQVTPTDGADFQYDGAVVVTLPQWGVTAYGSYAEIHGEPSMFVFLQVSGAFGGPPAFFVTGLAGGFGYNSSVRIPAPDEVIAFPLVGGLSNPALLGGAKATPMQALAALTGGANPWIGHSLGQNWLAVGVRFTTFQLLESTALLVVEFGNELTIALLGISTARFPKSAAQRPYAQIQLQLRALLRPNDGFFALTASLTRNSFLLDPACALTGGFAFYVWFGPHPRAGDFVVVLGGYHPNFVPPGHYPAVAPLGFSWSLDRTVSISGSVYFALTPAAVMAGGALAVRYNDGNLRAWFTAHADLIMLWSPFHFSVDIGVSIGVEYTIDLLFTRKTLHLEAGADLRLAGPPTGGTARVRLWVVSFTVAFGAQPTSDPDPLDWAGFQALLPPAPDTTTFTATAGLAAQQTDNAAVAAAAPVTPMGAVAPAPWSARSDGFAFSVRSAVPSTRVFLGQQAQTPFRTGDKINIRPMRRTGLTVDQRVWITVDGAEIDLLAAGWTVTATAADVPKALWGTGDGKGVPAGTDQLVKGQITGLAVRAPVSSAGWSGGPVAVATTLGVDSVDPAGVLPVTGGVSDTTGDVPVAGGNVVALIADQIATAGIARRDRLHEELAALGIAPVTNGPLTRFAAQADVLFTDQPLFVPA